MCSKGVENADMVAATRWAMFACGLMWMLNS